MTVEEGGPPERWFFVHLQKTGGTALFQRLRDHFGREGVYPLPEDQGTPAAVLDVDLLRERVAAGAESLRVVTGHFPLCTTEVLGLPFTTFTVLRDPVERTLSFLRHQRKVEPALADVPLEVIYDDPERQEGLIRNHMVKMLSLTVEEMTHGALTPVAVGDEHLARAERNLVERIDVFGLQEHFDALCADLEARYGWDLGPPRFANRTFERTDVDDAFRRRIAEDNAADVELYATARRVWAERHPAG